MLTGLPISGSDATNWTSKPSGTTNARNASAGLCHGVERTISSKEASEAHNETADAQVPIHDRRTRCIDKKFNAAPKTDRSAGFRRTDGFMDCSEQTPESTGLQTRQIPFEGLQGSTPSILRSVG
jgi:hypothetical protein